MKHNLDYQKIQELFGAPLETVPQPNIPFKVKGWHIVAGLAVLGLAAYGGYHLYKDIKEKFRP